MSGLRGVPLLKREFPVQECKDFWPVVLSRQAPRFGGMPGGIRTDAHVSFGAREDDQELRRLAVPDVDGTPEMSQCLRFEALPMQQHSQPEVRKAVAGVDFEHAPELFGRRLRPVLSLQSVTEIQSGIRRVWIHRQRIPVGSLRFAMLSTHSATA